MSKRSGGSDKSERVQDRLIAALLTAPSQQAAADQAGISLATVQRYLKKPDFAAAYRTARRSLVEQSLADAQRAGGAAIAALVECLHAPRHGDRIRAAQVLLEHGLRGMEVGDLLERMEELEQLMKELQGGEEADTAVGQDAGESAGDGD